MDAFREMWAPWPKAVAVFAWMAGAGGCSFAFLMSLVSHQNFSFALAAAFGVPVAILFMLVLPMLTGRSSESSLPRLGDGERWARLVQDRQGAVGRGGRLILREQTLAFDASAFERNIGAASWELPLGEIASVEVIGPSKNFLAGGFRRRLKLTTRDGETKLLLTVAKLRDTAAEIEAAARVAAQR